MIKMTKTFSIIILLLIFNFALKAQEQFIIINGGITKPVSDFAESNYGNPDAGFATSGYNIGFEIAHFFNPWVGIGGSFKFNNSGFDNQRFNDYLDLNYGSKLDTISLNSGEYNLHNFLAGPYAKIDLGSRVSFFGKAFIGVLSTFRPDQHLLYRNFGDLEDTNLYLQGKLTGAFAWNFGAGMLIKLSDSFGITATADYIGANPKFDVFNYETFVPEKVEQPVRYVNLNVGIALTM